MASKYVEFTYNEKPRAVYRIAGKDHFIEGIDISQLEPDEVVAFGKLTEEFHKKLEPYMAKAYRRFDPAKIVPLRS